MCLLKVMLTVVNLPFSGGTGRDKGEGSSSGLTTQSFRVFSNQSPHVYLVLMLVDIL